MLKVKKRDGRIVDFDYHFIAKAIHSAFISLYPSTEDTLTSIAVSNVCTEISDTYNDGSVIDIEDIQNTVEKELSQLDYNLARHYMSYRDTRTRSRNANSAINKTISKLIYVDSKDNDDKRENANIDSDASMGAMLKIGGTVTKEFNLNNLINPVYSQMHRDGLLHIHDLDFYALCFNCLQIPLAKLLRDGFATGHGYLRTPATIGSAATLTCIILQASQNDMFGGQAIPTFDYDLAPYVAKSYVRNIARFLEAHFIDAHKCFEYENLKENFIKPLDEYIVKHRTIDNNDGHLTILQKLNDIIINAGLDPNCFTSDEQIACMSNYAQRTTDRETYQAMEATVHNLCTLASRAGAQVPFSSLNLGTCTTSEGRMVTRNLLLAVEAGLGYGETAIFPITVFKLKKGVNRYPGDPNYDLKKLALRVTAKRLFPNFVNLDAPFNLKYYKEGKPETEVTAMGCRTRTIANVYDPTKEVVTSRGNLFFTTINLPYIALDAVINAGEQDRVEVFFNKLTKVLDDVVKLSLDRLETISRRKAKNYPFLMGQHLYIDSEKLMPDDEIRDVVKHGSMTAGFIGLSEALVALTGMHHGESAASQELGLRIVKFMNDYMDETSKKLKLNFGVMGSPAEGCSGRLLRLTRKKFGIVDGVTDKEYFTNSFHIDVRYSISAYDKIQLEAPYHQYCPAGQISYLELTADAVNNLDGLETLVDAMCDAGMGYFAINHPVDRDPVCGYVGYFPDGVCPRCGRREGEGVPVSKLLSLTSYSPDPEYDARKEISSSEVTLNLVE